MVSLIYINIYILFPNIASTKSVQTKTIGKMLMLAIESLLQQFILEGKRDPQNKLDSELSSVSLKRPWSCGHFNSLCYVLKLHTLDDSAWRDKTDGEEWTEWAERRRGHRQPLLLKRLAAMNNGSGHHGGRDRGRRGGLDGGMERKPRKPSFIL